jgi:hypothetical protein
MVEVLKHMLGICGEHWHPNVFTFIISGVGSLPIITYIRYKILSYTRKSKANELVKNG